MIRAYGILGGMCIVFGLIAVALLGNNDSAPVPEISTEGWIPADYYNMPIVDGEFSMNTLSLPVEIIENGWIESYEADGFDCSQQAAFLEWGFENSGTETRICVHNRFEFPDGITHGHAWVQIRGDDIWEAIEPTNLGWMPRGPENWQYYSDEKVCFDNIHEIADEFAWTEGGEAIFNAEWGWWEEE